MNFLPIPFNIKMINLKAPKLNPLLRDVSALTIRPQVPFLDRHTPLA